MYRDHFGEMLDKYVRAKHEAAQRELNAFHMPKPEPGTREEKIASTWTHIASAWSDKELKNGLDPCKWTEFCDRNNQTEAVKKSQCWGCGQMCLSDYVSSSVSVCAFCDDRFQPWLNNPKNAQHVQRYLIDRKQKLFDQIKDTRKEAP